MTRAKNIQDEPEAFCSGRKQENAKKKIHDDERR